MKKKLKNLKDNPEFQLKIKELKPKKSIWGFLSILLFFFVPEILNVLYYKEINHFVATHIDNSIIVLVINSSFNGNISWFNIILGVLFLIWLFKD